MSLFVLHFPNPSIRSFLFCILRLQNFKTSKGLSTSTWLSHASLVWLQRMLTAEYLTLTAYTPLYKSLKEPRDFESCAPGGYNFQDYMYHFYLHVLSTC
jgi:hypothetical protein